MNFDVLRASAAFIFQVIMAKRIKLEQKTLLDLPDEVIEDKIMKLLRVQDLYNLIAVGNERLKDCSHNVIKKRPVSKYHLSIVLQINVFEKDRI